MNLTDECSTHINYTIGTVYHIKVVARTVVVSQLKYSNPMSIIMKNTLLINELYLIATDYFISSQWEAQTLANSIS